MAEELSLQDQILNLRAYVGTLDLLVQEMFRMMEKREIVYREFVANFPTFEALSQFEDFEEHELEMNRALFEKTKQQLQEVLSKPAPE